MALHEPNNSLKDHALVLFGSKLNIHLCCVQTFIANIDNDIYDEKQLYRYENMDISLKTGLLSLVYQKSVID